MRQLFRIVSASSGEIRLFLESKIIGLDMNRGEKN
jgi:hypothetical protein